MTSKNISLNTDYIKFSTFDVFLAVTFAAFGYLFNGMIGVAVALFVYFLLYITEFILFVPFGFFIYLAFAFLYLDYAKTYILTGSAYPQLHFIFFVTYYIIVIFNVIEGIIINIGELAALGLLEP